MSTIEGHEILLLCKQNNALRQQVADLRAALRHVTEIAHTTCGYVPDICSVCGSARVLAATQPQEVQP